MSESGAYIGRSVRSREAQRHVRGRGRYVDDMVLPRMLHAFVLRSPYGHARIESVDAAPALDRPGVVGALTPDDVTRLTKPFKPGRYAAGLRAVIDEFACAVGKVRYAGEPVAMVAAESRAQAEDGAEAIDVFYDPLPAVTSIANASAPGAPLIYEELGTNVPWQGHVAFGDVDSAFARADRVVREQLKIHRYSSTPLEPFAMIAEYTHERLTKIGRAHV